jgi:hypothetical protein
MIKEPKTHIIFTHNRNRNTTEYKENILTRKNVERKRESTGSRKGRNILNNKCHHSRNSQNEKGSIKNVKQQILST